MYTGVNLPSSGSSLSVAVAVCLSLVGGTGSYLGLDRLCWHNFEHIRCS